jgi:hypothetical protein
MAVVATVVACAVAASVGRWTHGLTTSERPWRAAPPAATGTSHRPMPLPTCRTCVTGKTFPVRVGPRSSGARTFRDPLALGGEGDLVKPRQRVWVVCRFHDPHAPASVGPGWWYLIASPPWRRQYYSPANSFLNGDPAKGPYDTVVNRNVPVC